MRTIEPEDEEKEHEFNEMRRGDRDTNTLDVDSVRVAMASADSLAGGGSTSSEEILAQKLERQQNNTLQRMKFYPMILIFCYLFATIRRVLDWATEDQTPFYWAMLHTFFAAIPGLLNAVVYGLTKDVKRKNIEFWSGVCGRNKGRRSTAVSVGDDGDSEDERL